MSSVKEDVFWESGSFITENERMDSRFSQRRVRSLSPWELPWESPAGSLRGREATSVVWLRGCERHPEGDMRQCGWWTSARHQEDAAGPRQGLWAEPGPPEQLTVPTPSVAQDVGAFGAKAARSPPYSVQASGSQHPGSV